MRVVAPRYPTSSLMSGLLASWRLNEASGAAYDELGQSDLTDNNTVTAADGKIYGLSRQFTRVNTEYFSLADKAAFSGLSAFSIEAWLWHDTLVFSGVMGKFHSATVTLREFAAIYRDAPAGYEIQIADGTGSTTVQNTGTVPTTGTWNHAVFTFSDSADRARVYCNGSAPTEGSVTRTIPDTAANVVVGSRSYDSPGTDAWNGRIGPLRMWSRELEQFEASLLWNNGNGLAYPFHGRALIPGVPYSAQPMLIGAR